MVKKINKYSYEISTAGLGGKMHFDSVCFCGKIKYGIGLNISVLRGSWVISLSDAWKLVLLSTVKAIMAIAHQGMRQTAAVLLNKRWGL